jgi:hypothetical protein
MEAQFVEINPMVHLVGAYQGRCVVFTKLLECYSLSDPFNLTFFAQNCKVLFFYDDFNNFLIDVNGTAGIIICS